MVIGPGGVEVDAVGTFRKHVDRRRAERQKVVSVNDVFQFAAAFGQLHDDLELLTDRPVQGPVESAEVDEAETLRKGEVLAQQPISVEGA